MSHSSVSVLDRGTRLLRDQPGAAVLWLIAAWLLLDLVLGLASGRIAVSRLATFAWDGITLGLVLGLAGIGLSMTYSILNFANFAHGDYITGGAFVGWSTTYLISGIGSNATLGSLVLVGAGGTIYAGDLGINIAAHPVAIIAGLLVAAVATVLFSLAMDRAVFKPLRKEEGITLLIASIGVALTVRYLVVFVFQQSTRGVTANVPGWRIPFVDGVLNVSYHEATLVVASVALMLGVHFILQQTKLGKAMRAMADNKDLAQVTGIPTERVVQYTWIIGGALTGASGYLIALERGTLGFNLGWLLLLLIFAAVILGGIGSIYGAIGGGLIIGLASKVSLLWLPEASFARPAAFLIMILILIYKPSGLFSGRATA
jgi:branched-chain amino acid transport system permease protein